MAENSLGLHLLAHIKNYHWNSMIKSEHETLDSLYSAFSNRLDNLIESLIANNQKREPLKIKDKKFKDIHELVDFAIKHYEKLAMEYDGWLDINNICADIVEIFTKHKYLLQMK